MTETPGILRNTTGTMSAVGGVQDNILEQGPADGVNAGILEREYDRFHEARAKFRGHVGAPGEPDCKACGKPKSEWGIDACTGIKPAPAPPPDEYAVVEVFGHQRHVGRISEVERFGTKMLRVDEPADVLAEAADIFAGGCTSYFLSGASIFRLTPCTLPYIRVYYAKRAPAQLGYLQPSRSDFQSRDAYEVVMGVEDVTEHIVDEPAFEPAGQATMDEIGDAVRDATSSFAPAHVAVEGADRCFTCSTPLNEWGSVPCSGLNGHIVSRETDGAANG